MRLRWSWKVGRMGIGLYLSCLKRVGLGYQCYPNSQYSNIYFIVKDHYELHTGILRAFLETLIVNLLERLREKRCRRENKGYQHLSPHGAPSLTKANSVVNNIA